MLLLLVLLGATSQRWLEAEQREASETPEDEAEEAEDRASLVRKSPGARADGPR